MASVIDLTLHWQAILPTSILLKDSYYLALITLVPFTISDSISTGSGVFSYIEKDITDIIKDIASFVSIAVIKK